MPKIVPEKLSQMMMVGFEGTTLPDFYFDWLRRGLGGIVLFSRNIEGPEQLARLTDEIQHGARHVPALIATDQEGGRVFRLKEPFTHFPTAQTVGRAVEKSASPDYAYKAARATALELAAMGIRLNFAPVLDVHTNPKNPIIGDRAYASEPRHVAAVAQAVIDGFRDEGVIACGKHFPGHGDTAQDSHLDLPHVEKTAEELRRVELAPFREIIQRGVPMIMTAHVLYPALDPENPATMSEKILWDCLRNELFFSGVLICDDLEMKAIQGRYTWREVVCKAVNAGVDILLVCKVREIQEKVFAALEEGVATGEIPLSRVKESLARIEKLKKEYLKDPRPFPEAEWKKVVGCDAHRQLVAELNRFA